MMLCSSTFSGLDRFMEVTICIAVFFQLSSKQDNKLAKPETQVKGGTNQTQAKAVLTQDNVKIKGLQANVSIPKVMVCFRALANVTKYFLSAALPNNDILVAGWLLSYISQGL